MNTKETIINNALKLFSIHGYDAVGVQEIVEKSNITKPSLYYHFGSKIGLLNFILTDNFAVLNREIEISAEYNHDITGTLNKIAHTYFNFARQNQNFYRFQLSLYFTAEGNEANKAVKEHAEVQYHIVENLFLIATDDHGNMKGRHREYAATFIGMINTYIVLCLNNYVKFDDILIHKAVHQFMHGIFS